MEYIPTGDELLLLVSQLLHYIMIQDVDAAAAVDEDSGELARGTCDDSVVEDEGVATRTSHNRQVILPNGSLSNNNLTNVTAQKRRRLEIKVGISYQSDLKRAKEILEGLFAAHALVRQEEGILVFVDSLGDSAVLLGARAWVATGDYWSVRWELTEKLKLAFDEAGIDIPYHQVDVHHKN